MMQDNIELSKCINENIEVFKRWNEIFPNPAYMCFFCKLKRISKR